MKASARQSWDQVFNREDAKPDKDRLKIINGMADEIRAMSDEEIVAEVDQLREELQSGQRTLGSTVERGFALLREGTMRAIGMFHYDVQILAGLALVRGGISEMATGEGKTLAVSLPAFIFALDGKGVHVVTVNSYLAERDYEFSKPIFDFFGISIDYLPEGKDATPEGKKAAYEAEITYGVGYEYGFDYMKDQLARMRHPDSGPGEELRFAILGKDRPEPDVNQRGLAYAIIDEVDSVLIDEAGSPLLISEAADSTEGFEQVFHAAKEFAGRMMEDEHFTIDSNTRAVELTEFGKRELFRDHGAVPWSKLRRPWETYVVNALKAKHIFKRDEQYIVVDNSVVIVDEFTGRPFPDRSWREGQHQAVEAEEDCEIRPESDSAASMTRQRFYAMYERICGLTGTGMESGGEFWRFFEMPVMPIPLHQPSQRVVHPERVFVDVESRDQAIVNDIASRYKDGQPILVGTRTIVDSERIAGLLEEAGVTHQVLTAKHDEAENEILATAGESGSVLIATNMAGRGTHIGLSDEAKEAGGLHVIQVERNESVRIDRQLVGRGARQGQPGSAQAFVSAEDYIIDSYSPEAGKQLRRARADENGELSGSHSKIFDRVQAEVERARYEMRLNMAERDKWLDETKESLAR